MIDLTVDFSGADDPFLRRFTELWEGDLTPVHEAIVEDAQLMTEDYLHMIAGERHDTANNLGAKPTGALEKAADRVTSSADSEKGTVTVVGALFARAFRDVTITPTNGSALTIPIDKEAYGRRVAELKAEGWVFFMPKKQNKPLLWASDPSGESRPMYLLASSVNQSQDRTLLPSDEDLMDAAVTGADRLVQRERSNRGLAA